MLQLVVLVVESKVVIASNDDLMLVRQLFKKNNKAIYLSPIAILSEVTCVDKYICLGELLNVYLVVRIVGVAHGYYFNLSLHLLVSRVQI